MATNPVPDHVPPEMVRDFSLFTSPGMPPTPNGDPHAAVARVHDGPPIFYSRYNTQDGRGTWVITRAADQRRVLQDAETFSSHRSIFSSILGENWPTIPLELDPPAHGVFRSLLSPLLSPKRVLALEPAVRERAVELIERIAASGTSCDVMKDFAFPFAVSTFLRFLGLPDDRLDTFVGWGKDLLHGDDKERPVAARTIVAFIDELAAMRRDEAVDDFMTFIVQAQVEGRRLTDTQVRGIGVLVFVAGLDTVAAAIGFDLAYLARNLKDQQLLRSEPDRIPLATEELLRAYPPIQLIRVATKDIDFEGAPIRKGDYVSCATMIANRDPAEFECPNTIDLEREDNRHAAFGYGPHRCLGSHLARREIVIGLEEWLARIPAFRIKRGTAPITTGGHVFGIENLILDWS
ncbi:cytochrome P450 [Mesorhizobium sp. LNJC399B00]|uniref:cytochrome P450 n=1 Tax=unclassified Mesorhizobium TaxID=325217 RepID=UPI0003CF317A|nr:MULTISPECIES: cytochrome P450 [unclassified Mesorhizobium]ESY03410.1 cytochrome P450 [Mesorhizobium sp. LNJC399B00]WJI67288.1 cytochrome P450 [Mesorhizobium sp. C399B]